MILLDTILVLDALIPVISAAALPADPSQHQCRYAPSFSQTDVLRNSTAFEAMIVAVESNFYEGGSGYSYSNGLTKEYRHLGYMTGLPTTGAGNEHFPESVSTPRNEAFHIMLLTQAISGNPQAAQLLAHKDPPWPVEAVVNQSRDVLAQKLDTFHFINNTWPGYGGFLPSLYTDTDAGLRLHPDWDGRLSAVENGHLVWAIYGLIQALSQSNRTDLQVLGHNWTDWFTHARYNARGIFMPKNLKRGQVCAVVRLVPGTYTYASFQQYTCESTLCTITDPYDGELITWFLYFSGTLDVVEAAVLWDVKRPYLQAVNYTGSAVNAFTRRPGLLNHEEKKIDNTSVSPITVQRGYFFSSDEQLKLLTLPYRDVPIVDRVYSNAERVRTCNSMLTYSPGLFSGTFNITTPSMRISTNLTHVYGAGIPAVSFNTTQELDLICPGAAWPTILFDRGIGLAWYKNMLDGRGVQSYLGAVDATRRDGSAVSSIVSWRSKAPIMLALLGGITDLVRQGLQRDGVYGEFIRITTREYQSVFDPGRNGGAPLVGENVTMCLPNAQVPHAVMQDYVSCR